MLDPFAPLFQHCWGHARSLRMVYKDLLVVSFHDAPQVSTLLGVAASVCRQLPTRTQQLPTLLAQQCWELLRPFARSLRIQELHSNNKQIIQLERNRIKKPNWQVATSWLLFTSMAEDLNLG